MQASTNKPTKPMSQAVGQAVEEFNRTAAKK